MRLKSSSLLFIAFVLIGLSFNVYAAKTKQQAAKEAQYQQSGRVLSVKQKGRFYKVKILSPKGEVHIVRVPLTAR